MRSSWFIQLGQSNDRCPYKRQKRRHRRGGDSVKTEVGVTQSHAREAWAQQKLEEAGRILFRACEGYVVLLTA